MSGEVVLAYLCIHLAPVVRRMDKAIHQINRYPVHKCLKKNKLRYPLDSDLSGA